MLDGCVFIPAAKTPKCLMLGCDLRPAAESLEPGNGSGLLLEAEPSREATAAHGRKTVIIPCTAGPLLV